MEAAGSLRGLWAPSITRSLSGAEKSQVVHSSEINSGEKAMKQPVLEGSTQLGAVGAESWGQSWPGCGLERYHGQAPTESQVRGAFFWGKAQKSLMGHLSCRHRTLHITQPPSLGDFVPRRSRSCVVRPRDQCPREEVKDRMNLLQHPSSSSCLSVPRQVRSAC